jgi:hypothetical protein
MRDKNVLRITSLSQNIKAWTAKHVGLNLGRPTLFVGKWFFHVSLRLGAEGVPASWGLKRRRRY